MAREAANATNSARLNGQLLAEEIANGHAFAKHVLDGNEFEALGISTRQQFQDLIEGIVSNPSTEVRYASNGKIFFLDNSTRTVVIKNPTGEATAFRPDYGPGGIGWDRYVNERVPSISQSAKNNPGYDPVENGRKF